MSISLYIHKMLYKFGGTESFTAKFLEIIQDLYPNENVSMITECFKEGDELSAEQMAERLNGAYGTKITPKNFSLSYIYTKEPKLSENKIVRIFSRMCRKCNLLSFQKKLCSITRKDDLFINCSNQMVVANAKRNITIIHFPQDRSEVTGINKQLPFFRPFARISDKKYKDCYEYFMPNSYFTAGWLKKKWGIEENRIRVFYPLITPINVKCDKNKNQIFICGRIEASKKIDVMVKAFNSSKVLKDTCTLKIAGSCDNEDTTYIDYIRSLSSEKVEIILSPSRIALEKLYVQSGIFWHAKGYGETNPMQMEHFGMTTVEAMSAGCIPVVINKGGQTEIVKSECGYLWNEPEELVSYTEKLLNLPDKQIEAMREACIERSRMCSKERFRENIKEIFGL